MAQMMRKKSLVVLVIVLTAPFVITIVVVLLIRQQVATSLAIEGPRAIDESGYVHIGGIPQYVRIRGRDKGNPVILFLHGGPGGAVLSVSNQPFAPWEQYFTIVQWDQRGSGRTYAANGYDASETTIGRLVSDGIEIAEHVRQRLGTQRLILVGHSWGSHLGFKIVQQRPDLFSAYVATGLWVNFGESQGRLYQVAVDRARADHNPMAIRELKAVGHLPFDDLRRWKIILKWSAMPGDPTFPSHSSLVAAATLSPDYRLVEAMSYVRGFKASTENLGKQAMHDNLDPSAQIDLPIFLFQGAKDGHVDPRLAISYVKGIRASRKEVVLFENGGHYVHVDDSQRFLRELLRRVKPFS
jgi:pimeloyl-ACP methyl ester carboxylesterase